MTSRSENRSVFMGLTPQSDVGSRFYGVDVDFERLELFAPLLQQADEERIDVSFLVTRDEAVLGAGEEVREPEHLRAAGEIRGDVVVALRRHDSRGPVAEAQAAAAVTHLAEVIVLMLVDPGVHVGALHDDVAAGVLEVLPVQGRSRPVCAGGGNPRHGLELLELPMDGLARKMRIESVLL